MQKGKADSRTVEAKINMHNITLISTSHTESGKCNSDELYKIIESINPEVIFEELPPHWSDMFYSDSFDMRYSVYCDNNLLNRRLVVPFEVKCIKKYKQNYNIKIFPVDIDVNQKSSKYQDEIVFMNFTFMKHDDYIKLDNEQDSLIAREGFDFLNSDKYWDLLEKKEIIEKSIMESEIHKDRLLHTYKLFHEEQYDTRENAMLKNIYNYSKKNQYNQAVFLIGVRHRKSIIQKIIEFEKTSETKLNWTIYGNKQKTYF